MKICLIPQTHWIYKWINIKKAWRPSAARARELVVRTDPSYLTHLSNISWDCAEWTASHLWWNHSATLGGAFPVIYAMSLQTRCWSSERKVWKRMARFNFSEDVTEGPRNTSSLPPVFNCSDSCQTTLHFWTYTIMYWSVYIILYIIVVADALC